MDFAIDIRSPIPEKQDTQYLAMSRAPERLYITYFGKLPRLYDGLCHQNVADFVG